MSNLASRNVDDQTEITSVRLKITYIPRQLVKGFAVSPVEEMKFYSSPLGSLSEEQLIAGEQPISGIIVGEGDAGKTRLTERLAKLSTAKAPVKVFPLRRYGSTNPHLSERVSQFIEDTKDCSWRTVVLDGLDENLDVAGAIEELCDDHLKDESTVRFWITSRPRHAVNQLLRRIPRLQAYHLMPFTDDEIKRLAKGAGLDDESFMDALRKTDLRELARKPGGAVMLMDLFASGTLSADRNKLLHDIVQSLVGSRRDGAVIPTNETGFSENMLLEVAGWTATWLTLGQKDSVWVGDTLNLPPTALSFGELERGVYSYFDLSELLKRRLFEPLDNYRYRFVSDETLLPFLTAWWLNLKSGGQVKNLFKTEEGIGKTLGTVLPVLARFHPDQADDWLSQTPQLFSDSPQAITAFGVEKYYDALKGYQKRAPWQFVFDCAVLFSSDDYDDLRKHAFNQLSRDDVSVDEAILAATVNAAKIQQPVVAKLADLFARPSLDVAQQYRLYLLSHCFPKDLEKKEREQLNADRGTGLQRACDTDNLPSPEALLDPDPKKAESAFDALLSAHVLSLSAWFDFSKMDLRRLFDVHFWLQKKSHPVSVSFANGETVCKVVSRNLAGRILRDPLNELESILREVRKQHPDDGFVKDCWLEFKQRQIDELPPKLANPKLLDEWVKFKGEGTVPARKASKNVKMVRAGREVNIGKLRGYLKDQLTEMLNKGMTNTEREARHKFLAKGKNLAKQSKIRVGDVGQIVRLRQGHKRTLETCHPDKIAHVFYVICSDPAVFEVFRRHVGTFTKSVKELTVEDLYERLKDVVPVLK